MKSRTPPQRTRQHAGTYKPRTFFLGKERGYFVENLSLLLSSGMTVLQALDSIGQELRSHRMKKLILVMSEDIESGSPLWKALLKSRLFPGHAISLIKLGEQSGKLTQNLAVVAIEQEKSRAFRDKLRSAMMYPLFVLALTIIVGTGITWFILPKLAIVFNQLKLELPLITKVLIGAGTFLGEHGAYVVPVFFFVLITLFCVVFIFSKTNFIGQRLLFSLPVVNKLIKQIELARFGYLLGTLLEAGLPPTRALESIAAATEFSLYRKFYAHVCKAVEDGNSLQKSFDLYPHSNRLVPIPVQQLIFAGERSGSLSKILLKIGTAFETRADTTTKNLTVLLEPLLLVIVWIGVVGVALAVILPIYNLIGGLNT
ncbi:MAG: Uncharacterized protein G01um101472_444 [Parcubacteria group bacterium Gr01-1014_72]|nr:MAG: Uncharacterized protein Greene041614_1098 [Parcubacteria group bacterium Greene0416_14]TSC67346.1 MAG: Uncharacterized protein G01um101472_444 [Parcubacteria group bacterium Gr01-1014_72]